MATAKKEKPTTIKMFDEFIHDTPEYLKEMTARGEKPKAVFLLAQVLKTLPSTKSMIFSVNDFEEKFNGCATFKTGLNNVRAQLVKHGVNNPKVVFVEDRVHITHTPKD